MLTDARAADGRDAHALPGAVAERGARCLAIGDRRRIEARDVAGEAEVLLGPLADRRQAFPEAFGHDVLGVADEQRQVAHPRITRDLLQQLLVEVTSQERLALAALGHRQPPDEVAQPYVGGGLQLGVLVEEVVELPRLVSDPQVILLVRDQIVEHHEVRNQDLVHPPERLEHIQLVLVGLGLDVGRFAGEQRAGGMDPLAARLEHLGDRVLGEPVDLEIGVEPAKLLRYRDIAAGVAEPDRGGHIQRSPRSRPAPRPAPRRGRRADEVAEQQVQLDRVAGVRDVAGALERHERAAGRVGQRPALPERPDQVGVAVDHERRTPNSCAHLAEVLVARETDAAGGVRERLGRGVEPPANRVLDLLGRVRLVETLGGEELEEVAVVPLPIEAVVLRPPLVTVERLVERHVPLGVAGGQSNRGCDVDDPVHPLGMVGGDDRPPQSAAR